MSVRLVVSGRSEYLSSLPPIVPSTPTPIRTAAAAPIAWYRRLEDRGVNGGCCRAATSSADGGGSSGRLRGIQWNQSGRIGAVRSRCGPPPHRYHGWYGRRRSSCSSGLMNAMANYCCRTGHHQVQPDPPWARLVALARQAASLVRFVFGHPRIEGLGLGAVSHTPRRNRRPPRSRPRTRCVRHGVSAFLSRALRLPYMRRGLSRFTTRTTARCPAMCERPTASTGFRRGRSTRNDDDSTGGPNGPVCAPAGPVLLLRLEDGEDVPPAVVPGLWCRRWRLA